MSEVDRIKLAVAYTPLEARIWLRSMGHPNPGEVTVVSTNAPGSFGKGMHLEEDEVAWIGTWDLGEFAGEVYAAITARIAKGLT